jgi:predicted nucleotidyltransferase
VNEQLGSKGDVEATLAAHLAARPPAGVVSVYLFGSQAAGRAHRESDVDVAVLLRWDVYPTSRERFEARLRLITDFATALGRHDVDLVVLNDAPPLLGRHVVTTGRRLLCTDPEADHVYVRDVQLRAADLQPWLERMARIKLDALRR